VFLADVSTGRWVTRAWFRTYDCVANARVGKRRVAKCILAEEVRWMEKGGVIETFVGSMSDCLVD
jgi:hypothetical protein